MSEELETQRLMLRESPGRGRGVFAGQDFDEGDVVETAAVIVLPPEQHRHVRLTVLDRYEFSWPGVDGAVAIPLGYGMLYNHSTEPNAMFAKDDDDNLMHYVALRPIAKGEEILINYGRGLYRENLVDPVSFWTGLKPKRSIIVAAGAGIALAIVTGRRRRARRSSVASQ